MSGSLSQPLYAAQEKIYAREVSGRFNRLRIAAVWTLLGLFYLLPWLQWDGHQAVLFDLPARRFYLFGLILFPQDFIFLAWLLIIAALSLFFFTALAGRLWCGFACPQTVWTQVFVWMERWTEGSRSQQIKMAKAPWTVEKIGRKASKQFLWIVFAAYTGITFVGFFSPIRDLTNELHQGALGGWEMFWAVFYGFATYGNAGFMREQVCKYMCPYARFQSAMFDRNTLIVSYDAARGERRGPRARGLEYKSAGLGDCVDCTVCVQVCPTGIDIRKGLQYECIACTACIDACDNIMDKMNYPRGLIRYSTQAAMEGRATRVLRPRVLIYGTVLLVMIASFAYAITHREPIDVDVLRDRNGLYRRLDDGRIENVYALRLINKDSKEHRLSFSVADLPGAAFDSDESEYAVSAGGVRRIVARVRVPASETPGGHDFSFVVTDETGVIVYRARSRFILPSAR